VTDPKPIAPLPPPSEPFTDASGRVTLHWYLWLSTVDRILRDHESRITDHEDRIVDLEP
jgi:hypothetical protein